MLVLKGEGFVNVHKSKRICFHRSEFICLNKLYTRTSERKEKEMQGHGK